RSRRLQRRRDARAVEARRARDHRREQCVSREGTAAARRRRRLMDRLRRVIRVLSPRAEPRGRARCEQDRRGGRKGEGALTEIAVESVPRCYLCGETGEGMYRNLTDELYGVPGNWGFRRCPNDGLWWLDPRPLPSELPKVYQRYHTHAESDLRSSTLGRVRFALMPVFARAPFQSIRDIAEAERMWLPKKPGRLLDVGAGDGEFVARMRREGWDAQGVEPDPAAVARARDRYGVGLITGTVENVPGSEPFDAIT